MSRFYQRREFKRREYGKSRVFKTGHPIVLEVIMEENDTVERIIRRYLKKFKKLKLMEEFRQHDYYMKPSEKKRLKRKKAIAAIRRKQREREAKESY